MKITFFANYLNPHTIHLCNSFYKLLGEDFAFVSSEKIDSERMKLGWRSDTKMPYEIDMTENSSSYEKAIKLAIESDTIIHGNAPEHIITERMKLNKLTFRHSERFFKGGQWRIFSPRFAYWLYNTHTKYRDKNFRMLCASAYTSNDCKIVASYPNKLYKWGYFPEFMEYNIQELIDRKNHNIIKILWTGRFLAWKHPEKAIYIARRLKKDGYKFQMDMIGVGEKENDIKKLVNKYQLNDCVTFLGAMPPEKVREHMGKANIFLFTSDYNEGWGVVLNEAMNSGCAIVASHAAGAVPFLLKHMENGMVYHSDKIEELYRHTQLLINDVELREKLSENAYQTIKDTWNDNVAAKNFIVLCENLLADKPTDIENGPCSIAEAIPQHKMYSLIVNSR